jgi:membrane protein DedA with SNARE-associated domain
MNINVTDLRNDAATQSIVSAMFEQGRKVVFKFASSEEKAEFMHECGEIGGSILGVAGSLFGGAAGGAAAGALIGSSAGPVGTAIGAAIGTIVGALVGYTLGAWVAHFIFEIAKRLGASAINQRELWSWFGLRPNRVAVSIAA